MPLTAVKMRGGRGGVGWGGDPEAAERLPVAAIAFTRPWVK